MSNDEDVLDGGPPAIDPYECLGLDRDATVHQVKIAYRKAALKNHPDKVPEEKKAEAHEQFQRIAFAYSILSDPIRRKRYDTTGSTADVILDSDGFDWSQYYQSLYQDAISADSIAKFAAAYRNSDEEKDDILAAYERSEGDMDELFEHVMLSNPIHDEERFRAIIDAALKSEDVPVFSKYTKESKKKRQARMKKAQDEENEAEDYAKELGVHDKLFGSGKAGSKRKGAADDENDGLKALILKRQKDRESDNFLDRIAEKYAGKSSQKKGSTDRQKRAAEEEPSEEAFQAAAARLNKSKVSGTKRAKK